MESRNPHFHEVGDDEHIQDMSYEPTVSTLANAKPALSLLLAVLAFALFSI